MKGKDARGMVGLSRVLGWELRVSERKIFRSCSIHMVGMLRVIKVGKMDI